MRCSVHVDLDGWGTGDVVQRQRLVQRHQQTVMESAELDLWAGLDHVVFDDGIFFVAGLEIREI